MNTFFRKTLAITASFTPKYVHLQNWSLIFRQNAKMLQPKCWNAMQEQTQVKKKNICVSKMQAN